MEKQEYVDNYDDYFEQQQDGLHIAIDKESAFTCGVIYRNRRIILDWQDGFTFSISFAANTTHV